MDVAQFISLGAGGLAIAGVIVVLSVVLKAMSEMEASNREERKEWLERILKDKEQTQQTVKSISDNLASVANVLERLINEKR